MQIRWLFSFISLILCVFAWIVLDLRRYHGDTHTRAPSTVCRAVSLFRNSMRLIEWIAFCWKLFSILCIKCLFSRLTDFFLPFDHFANAISFHFVLISLYLYVVFIFQNWRILSIFCCFVFIFGFFLSVFESCSFVVNVDYTAQKLLCLFWNGFRMFGRPNGLPINLCMSIETTRSVGLHLTF